jgi:hypothetical protein
MRPATLLGTAVLFGAVSLPSTLSAQQTPDRPDLGKIFSAADSVNGAPVVDTLPELISCAQFDVRNIRGDETTFSFEHPPAIDEHTPPVSVTLEFVVGTDGRIERRSVIVRRTTNHDLDRSIEYWVVGCRFRPGKIGVHAVRVKMEHQWDLRPIP